MIGINIRMKQFIPTYLYIKTHNVTGLKYFGKTTNDPDRYRGSGKYWLAHIKKYSYDVTTEIFGYYIDKEQCIKAATQFSKDNNIVYAVNESNKKIWANQIIENGIDGGATGRTIYNPMSGESKKKMSDSKKGSIPWNKGKTGVTPGNKRPRSDETKQRLREANLGKKQSQETIDKRTAKLKGHIVTKETRLKISAGHKGKKLSDAHIQKLRNRVLTEEQKQHLREMNLGKKASASTKQKLSGMVVSINNSGELKRIPKDQYYSQTGPKEEWEWISHKSKQAKLRRQKFQMLFRYFQTNKQEI